MTKIIDNGIIVGRFQVAKLHAGHISLIRKAAELATNVIIFIGVARLKTTKYDPLDFFTRKRMLMNCADLTSEELRRVNILPIMDVADDEKWSVALDAAITSLIGIEETVGMFHSRASFIDSYSGQFSPISVDEVDSLSGRAERERIKKECYKNTKDFREGVIWATQQQYKKAVPVVDVALIRDEAEVLMAKKRGSDMFQFVGGFVQDGRYEVEAIRELREEVLNIDIDESSLKYIGSYQIEDDRFTNEEDVMISSFFRVDYVSGTPTGGDDLFGAEFEWIALTEYCNRISEVASPHQQMFGDLCSAVCS